MEIVTPLALNASFEEEEGTALCDPHQHYKPQHHPSAVIDISMILGIVLLLISGMAITTLGSMTGMGGGFLAVPLLIIAFGLGRPAAVVTSLVMIFFNSLSGTMENLRSRKVKLLQSVLLFVPALPGLFIGFQLLTWMEEDNTAYFDILFAILLMGTTVNLLLFRKREKKGDGNENIPWYGYPLSFAAGIISSIFGIGGGVIFMPLFVSLLGWDVKKSAATSLFIVAMMASFRVLVVSPDGLDPLIVVPLSIGAVIGGQIGPRLHGVLKGRTILYILGGVLSIIAVMMILSGINGLL